MEILPQALVTMNSKKKTASKLEEKKQLCIPVSSNFEKNHN